MESANSLVDYKYLIGLDTDKIRSLLYQKYKDVLVDCNVPISVNLMQLENSGLYTILYRIAVRMWAHSLLWQSTVANSEGRLQSVLNNLDTIQFRKCLSFHRDKLLLTMPLKVVSKRLRVANRSIKIFLVSLGNNKVGIELQFEDAFNQHISILSRSIKDLKTDEYETIASELINLAFYLLLNRNHQDAPKFTCPMMLTISTNGCVELQYPGYTRLSPYLLYSSKIDNGDSIASRDVKNVSKCLLEKLKNADNVESSYSFNSYVDVSDVEYAGMVVNRELSSLNASSMSFVFDNSIKRTYVIYNNYNIPIGLRHITGLKVCYSSSTVYIVALNLVQSELDLGLPSMSLNLETLARKPTIINSTYTLEKEVSYPFRNKDISATDAGLIQLIHNFVSNINKYSDSNYKFNCQGDLDRLSSFIALELRNRAMIGMTVERFQADVLYRPNKIGDYLVTYKTGVYIKLGNFSSGLTFYVKPKRNSTKQCLLQLSLDATGSDIDAVTLRVYTEFPIKKEIFSHVGLDIFMSNICRYALSKCGLSVGITQKPLESILKQLIDDGYFDDKPYIKSGRGIRFISNSIHNEVICITGIQVICGYTDALLGISISIDIEQDTVGTMLNIGLMRVKSDDSVERLTTWWTKQINANTNICNYGLELITGLQNQVNDLFFKEPNLSKERAFRIGTAITKCLEDKIISFSKKGIKVVQSMHVDWDYKTTLRYNSDCRIIGITRRNGVHIKYKKSSLCHVVVDVDIPDNNEEFGSYKIYLSWRGNNCLETCCSYTVTHCVTDDKTVISVDIDELLRLFYNRLIKVIPLESKERKPLSGIIGKHGAFDTDRRIGGKTIKEFRVFIKEVLGAFNEPYRDMLLFQTMDGMYAYKTDNEIATILGVGVYLEMIYFDDDVNSNTSSCYYLIKLVTSVGDCLLKYFVSNESAISVINNKFIEVVRAMSEFKGTLDDYIIRANQKLEQWARNNESVTQSYILGFFNYVFGSGITAEAFLAVLSAVTYNDTYEKSEEFSVKSECSLSGKYISWIEYLTRQPGIVKYLTDDDARRIEKGFIKLENLAYKQV